jgi:hypothetical protein
MAKVMLDKNGLARSAGTLTVYNFDAASGEFTGSNDEYLAQGVACPQMPASPPALSGRQAAVYRDGNWQVVTIAANGLLRC